MSSRVLIPFLCLGAVAFACGPRARNEASTPKKDSVAIAQSNGTIGTSTALAVQQGAPRAERVANPTVDAQLYVRTSGPTITFALHVVNQTKKKVELTFPSGQTHDFVIVDSLGREMWRWAAGRMFTQTLRNRLLGGGELFELEETMERKRPLPPGRYTARAILTSTNYPLVQQAEFRILATTVAAR